MVMSLMIILLAELVWEKLDNENDDPEDENGGSLLGMIMIHKTSSLSTDLFNEHYVIMSRRTSHIASRTYLLIL